MTNFAVFKNDWEVILAVNSVPPPRREVALTGGPNAGRLPGILESEICHAPGPLIINRANSFFEVLSEVALHPVKEKVSVFDAEIIGQETLYF